MLRSLVLGAFAAIAAIACFPSLDRGQDESASGPNGSGPPGTGEEGGPSSATEGGIDENDGAGPAPSSCSPDLKTDDENCGSCGHDCRGAKCSGGLCTAQELKKDLYEPGAIAIADGKVFYSTLGPNLGSPSLKGLHEVNVDGTSPRTLVTGEPGIEDIVVLPNLVVFRTWDSYDGGILRACNRTGACNLATIVSVIGAGRGLVSASGFLFWGGTFALRRCTALGCSPPEGVIMQSGVDLTGLVSDGTSLFWSNGRADYGGRAIYRCSLPACLDGAPLYSRSVSPEGIASSGSTLCWAEDASVVCAPASGGMPKTLASGDAAKERATSVALDGTHVYFALAHDDRSKGRVLRCGLGGCNGAPETIAIGQDAPRAIALDATHVYWATATGTGTGTIRRVAK